MMSQPFALRLLFLLIFTNMDGLSAVQDQCSILTDPQKVYKYKRPEVVTPPLELDVIQPYSLNEQDEGHMNYLKSARFVVYRADIELAIGNFLYHEVHRNKIISGASKTYLKEFVELLLVLNPLQEPSSDFLEDLRYWLKSSLRIFGYEITDFTECWEKKFGMVFNAQDYVGCRGSEPHMSGYPCAMWQLFHYLTVQGSDIHEGPFLKTAHVTKVITDFVVGFYSMYSPLIYLTFKELIEGRNYYMRSQDTEILWMWEIHNEYNKKYGELHTDTRYKKVLWPTAKMCPKCRTVTGTKMEWNRDEVLKFLKNTYRLKNHSMYKLTQNATKVNFAKRIRVSAYSAEFLDCNMVVGWSKSGDGTCKRPLTKAKE